MKDNKLIVLTLLKFFGIYILLTVLYSQYLIYYNDKLGTCDIFTASVAKQSVSLSNFLNFSSSYIIEKGEYFARYIGNGEYVSRVVEGCNAVSVMILFVSFVFAFSKSFKITSIFIIVGLIVIHLMNVFRVSLLNYIFSEHQKYSKISHDYLFPMIIYGTVVILWFIWIKFFLLKKTKKIENS